MSSPFHFFQLAGTSRFTKLDLSLFQTTNKYFGTSTNQEKKYHENDQVNKKIQSENISKNIKQDNNKCKTAKLNNKFELIKRIIWIKFKLILRIFIFLALATLFFL